jgi:hypothetical protein
MSSPKLYAVITTIQAPTAAVRTLCRRLRRASGQLLTVADRKGPREYPQTGAELFSLEAQLALPFRLPQLLPVNHYTRKNAGYLVAISRGAECIFETDDDNCPMPRWQPRMLEVTASKVTRPGWCNVYRYFSDEPIWPRGLPLERIAMTPNKRAGHDRVATVRSPIQQGLVDGSPDVDAIWRLTQDRKFRFEAGESVALMPGVWCPFNSQNTWWWPAAYPLMYLPSFCTFRMTDIWRSFVAQRCVWEMESPVVFHAADMVQRRNPHNLMKDFEDEVPGYLGNDRITRVLGDLQLEAGAESAGSNLVRCYEALVANKILPRQELSLVKAWVSDVKKAGHEAIS